ncbi:MAG: hypothetical protein HYU36_17715 [Planctomycetes bacterium]|nr:hypothetical protein [Planctomycetota bacterium]
MKLQFVLRLPYGLIETRDALKDSIALARSMRCDRVMLFNSRGHIEPAHLDREEVLQRAEVLRTAIAGFQKAGIGAGINNLATIGMNFSPPRKHRLPFQNLVDFDGEVFTETFCPLDSLFLDYLEFVFAAWAATGAEEVWVDDDFRYKNKASQCFCPLHLAQWEKLTGRSWSRDELVEALASPGIRPSERALRWGEFQNRAMLSAAEAIVRGTRRGRRGTRIGFMAITLGIEAYGRDYLARLGRIFSGKRSPLIRPEYGAYTDENRAAWSAYLPLWCCTRAFGRRFQAWPELETWPYTDFNHSRSVIQMKLAWGAAHGFTSSTLNVGHDARTARAVARARNLVERMAAALDPKTLRPRGVSLELSENGVGLRPRPGVIRVEPNPARVLARLGIPLWPDGGCGHVLAGNAPLVRARELKTFARAGLMVDRAAFEMLGDMGRDDILGEARSCPMGGVPVRETFLPHPVNGRAAADVISLEMAIPVRPKLRAFALPQGQEFTALSRFEDSDGQPLSPAVWIRQWPSGRLAVLPFSLDDPDSFHAFLNPSRKAQIEAILEWLARSPLPVTLEGVSDLAVVFREDPRRRLAVIGLANFGLDDAAGFSLVLPGLAGSRRAKLRMLGSHAPSRSREAAIDPHGRVRLGNRFRIPAQSVRLLEVRRIRPGRRSR